MTFLDIYQQVGVAHNRTNYRKTLVAIPRTDFVLPNGPNNYIINFTTLNELLSLEMTSPGITLSVIFTYHDI